MKTQHNKLINQSLSNLLRLVNPNFYYCLGCEHFGTLDHVVLSSGMFRTFDFWVLGSGFFRTFDFEVLSFDSFKTMDSIVYDCEWFIIFSLLATYTKWEYSPFSIELDQGSIGLFGLLKVRILGLLGFFE